ncbi:hypothetical protein VNI00_013168 [Paramarasmius palmivorus]|uniref:Fungal-type protein kinase domain-containing protein n=1 Tax=Paramarasmius palmivorus TaxID=297713 RepID=A0AAW0C1B8_9AGAR
MDSPGDSAVEPTLGSTRTPYLDFIFRNVVKNAHKDSTIPNLHCDIELQRRVQVEPSLVSTVLHEALLTIARSDEYNRLLGKYYYAPMKDSDEVERYPPFVALFDHAITEMTRMGLTKSESGFGFSISRLPKSIRHPKAYRCPDAAEVTAAALGLSRIQCQKPPEEEAESRATTDGKHGDPSLYPSNNTVIIGTKRSFHASMGNIDNVNVKRARVDAEQPTCAGSQAHCLRSDHLEFASLFVLDCETREARHIVMERFYPITDLTDSVTFLGAFKDTVKAHQWLVQHPKILHRDISASNLMVRYSTNEKVFGVLKDLDLACYIDKDDASVPQHRTGTKPFIAMHLMNQVRDEGTHYTSYDLESFVYVFAWILGRYEDGRRVDDPPYTEWTKETWQTGGMFRRGWLFGSTRHTTVTSTYASLRGVLVALAALLRGGIIAQVKQAMYNQGWFDQDTLGGHFTYTKFFQVLDQGLL